MRLADRRLLRRAGKRRPDILAARVLRQIGDRRRFVVHLAFSVAAVYRIIWLLFTTGTCGRLIGKSSKFAPSRYICVSA